MSEPREVCEVCGREKWAYSGLARTRQNCMREFAWAPDDNLRECYRLGYERLNSGAAKGASDRSRVNALLNQMQKVIDRKAGGVTAELLKLIREARS